MYDRATNKRIDLSDRQALVRLMDKNSVLTIKENMRLFDTDVETVSSASDQAVRKPLPDLVPLRDNLQVENATLRAPEKQALQGNV